MKKLPPSKQEVILALYDAPMSRSDLAKYINRKESSVCARVAELSYYIQRKGSKIDPVTHIRVEVLALNKHGIKRAVALLCAARVAA